MTSSLPVHATRFQLALSSQHKIAIPCDSSFQHLNHPLPCTKDLAIDSPSFLNNLNWDPDHRLGINRLGIPEVPDIPDLKENLNSKFSPSPSSITNQSSQISFSLCNNTLITRQQAKEPQFRLEQGREEAPGADDILPAGINSESFSLNSAYSEPVCSFPDFSPLLTPSKTNQLFSSAAFLQPSTHNSLVSTQFWNRSHSNEGSLRKLPLLTISNSHKCSSVQLKSSSQKPIANCPIAPILSSAPSFSPSQTVTRTFKQNSENDLVCYEPVKIGTDADVISLVDRVLLESNSKDILSRETVFTRKETTTEISMSESKFVNDIAIQSRSVNIIKSDSDISCKDVQAAKESNSIVSHNKVEQNEPEKIYHAEFEACEVGLPIRNPQLDSTICHTNDCEALIKESNKISQIAQQTNLDLVSRPRGIGDEMITMTSPKQATPTSEDICEYNELYDDLANLPTLTEVRLSLLYSTYRSAQTHNLVGHA
ncbi:unnamed protein product [Protopolystoma xenopodis]|uniref:Uncharacterized protein n=1 Tax=Protopolystoma xenopodis TaxID=117903 RepID=A0A448WE66_9PLAT|nr:unnamed protein product [Protopolystoma xenopodis]